MRRLPSILLLALISLNFYHGFSQQTTCAANQFLLTATNECVSACPATTYLGTQGTQQACIPQTAITATVRPIPEENSILVMFNNAQLPFLDSTDAVQVSIVGAEEDLATVSTFLSPDTLKTVFATPPIYHETMLQVTFRDYSIDNTSLSYIVPLEPFPYQVFAAPNDFSPEVVQALTRADRGLEWAWIAVTTLNPYAFLYMNTKLYRETLDVFKRTNIRFGRDATNFFQMNNNKVSGYKSANLFPILLEDNPVSSGWSREEENALPTSGMDQKRFNDLRLPSTNSVYTYDPYALFLDNYGSQISVFFGFAALIIIFEFLNIVLCCNRRKRGPSRVVRAFQAVRTFLRWNILVACILGSYQTLMYFFMVQMQVRALTESGDGTNLSLNFWFAIGTFIILAVLFPMLLAYKLRSISRQIAIEKEPLENHKFWGIFAETFNFRRRGAWSFIFALMIRTVIFAALTLFLDYNPVAQVAVMLAFSVLFTIYFLVLRPYKRLFHTIFQLANELVLIGFLCILIFLAQQAENDVVDDTEAATTGAVLIAFWLLIPTFAIVFGIIDIFLRIFRRKKQEKVTEKYIIEMAQQQSSQGMQIEPSQKETGEYIGETEQHTKVGNEVQTTEPLPLMLPIVTNEFTDINEAEPLQKSPETIEAGKKVAPLQIEATASRRAFPNLSYIEGIDTIIEDVEKEQASANLKDEGNKRRVKDKSLNNISMARSNYETPQQNEPGILRLKDLEPERKENLRMLNPVSTIGGNSLNASRVETDLNRTQDKIKAAPLSLDMPVSMRTSSRMQSDRKPKGLIFGNTASSTSNRFLPVDALDTSNMTSRSIMNLDIPMTMTMQSTSRSRPVAVGEGYKTVNKRLIFE